MGWLGKVTPQLTLGATWASKISGKFDNYKGLFADGGGFDVPENYGVGLAFEATRAWTLMCKPSATARWVRWVIQSPACLPELHWARSAVPVLAGAMSRCSSWA